MKNQSLFTDAEIQAFDEQGFIIVRGLVDRQRCEAIRQVAEAHLADAVGPVEYEAAVHYPGAPASLDAPGGKTIRRLLQAYQRHPLFQEWVTDPAVVGRLQQLLKEPVVLSQAHHNCVMTKQPNYSSLTNWHQDIRYWAFEKPDLISTWLAVGPEYPENGCLSFIPGTHRMQLAPERYDEVKFLRPDLPENQALIETRVTPTLEPGDVVFFHSRTFHAANRNETHAVKFSPVFTYHAASNRPLPDTRSTSVPEVAMPVA